MHRQRTCVSRPFGALLYSAGGAIHNLVLFLHIRKLGAPPLLRGAF